MRISDWSSDVCSSDLLTVNLHRQFQSPAWRLAVKALAALMTFYFVVALLGHYGGPDSAFGQVQAFFSGIGASLDPSVALDARSSDLATVPIVLEMGRAPGGARGGQYR